MPNEVSPTETRKSVAIFHAPRIPFHPAIEQKFGIDQGGWRVLIDSVWPGAKSADAVALALSYCKARRLDPFKRPVHIVPMWNSQLRQEVETVWPGISEIRTTASRTGQYAGSDPAMFGDEVTKEFTGATNKGERLSATVTFPAWCRVTVYRMIEGQRVPFPGPRVVWTETFSQAKGTAVPNARWCRAPYQMIEKCAEAAALRKAFPEELAGELTAEEMEGKRVDEPSEAPHKVAVEHEPPIDGTDDAQRQNGGPASDGGSPSEGPAAAGDTPEREPQSATASAPAPATSNPAAKTPPAPDKIPVAQRRFAHKAGEPFDAFAAAMRAGIADAAAEAEATKLWLNHRPILEDMERRAPEAYQALLDARDAKLDALRG